MSSVSPTYHPAVDAGILDFVTSLRDRPVIAMDEKVIGDVRLLTGIDAGLAFDRASVRSVDADGRMHVAVANISKANVCPYLGREIPDFEKLGLDPDRIYQLYRDPEELKKAAASFNNLPLLVQHTPVSADDPQLDQVVGTLGSEAEFVAPYLRNSLAVWTREGIDLIESEKQKELSCGYRYRAAMQPGTTPQGESFDGRMVDIEGNHCTIVKEGRAGPDVVVGDSALSTIVPDLIALDAFNEGDHPRASNGEFGSGGGSSSGGSEQKERIKAGLKQVQTEHTELKKKLNNKTITDAETKRLDAINKFVLKHKDAISSLKSKGSAADSSLMETFQMTKSALLSRKAALTHGAMMVYLLPKLAADAKVDLVPLFKDVTAKNFKEQKPAIVKGLGAITKGKLAKDASIEDVNALLDKLDGVEVAEAKDEEVEADPTETTMDDDPVAGLRAHMKSIGASDEDTEKACAFMKPKAAADAEETPEEKAAREKREKETPPPAAADAEEDKMKDMVSKKAMDSAVKLASDAAARRAEDATMKRIADIRIAERAVEPLIGKPAVALDSAEKIYAAALTAGGVKTEGIHASAFPAMVDLLVEKNKANAGRANHQNHQAQDAALTSDRTAFEKEQGIVPRKIRVLG